MLSEEEGLWFETLFREPVLRKTDQLRLARLALDGKIGPAELSLLEARFPGHFAQMRRELQPLKVAALLLVATIALLFAIQVW